MSATHASQPDRAKLAGRYRLLAAVLGFALMVLLAAAGRLEPDRRGYGTHQQFGLPPCTIYLVFGLRCPTCGMTTSWAHLVRGQIVGAVRANSGGAVLGLLAGIGGVWLPWSAARGRWIGWVPTVNACAWIAAAVVTVTIVDWGLRMLAR